jgi:DNA-binding transcriptional LysR family regulator
MTNPIDMRRLRYFLAVSEELNFGRAAARLHISQPPLSRQIRQLENQLGVALFHRHNAGVTLTEAGAAFLPEVRSLLAQAEQAVDVARATRSAEGGQFIVGYTTVFDRSSIPDVSESFHLCFPNWQLVTKGKHSISLVRDVKNRVTDAAFIELHTEAHGLTVEIVHEESLVAVLPADHRLGKKRQLGFDDLGGETMFWFERRLNPGFYDHCQAFFDLNNFKPTIIPEPPDHHILLGLVAEGKGFALIPTSLQNVKRQGVVFRKLKPEFNKLSTGIAVAYLEPHTSTLLREFLEIVKKRRSTPL